MLSKVQKWGNSQGLRFPKVVLEEAHINIGDEVEITVDDGKVILEKVDKIHGKYNLKDLVRRMPKNYQTKEVNWGSPVGKEEW